MFKNPITSAPLAVAGLLLVGAAMVSSCAKDEQAVPDTPVAASTANAYTGEALYRGIFFFDGAVAAKVPAFDSYRATIGKGLAQNPALAVERRRSIDAMVEAARRLDPTYFDRLQQAIQSQDFLRVKAVLKQGTALNEAVTLNALPSQPQKQEYLQRRRILQTLDKARYDFSKEQDITRYVKDARAALVAAGQDATPMIQAEVSMIMVYQTGDYVAYQSVSVFIAEHAHAFFEMLNDESADTQLKVDLLIKQIALNLS